MKSWAHSQDQDFWSGLNDEEQHEIKSAMRVRKLSRGDVLVEQGLRRCMSSISAFSKRGMGRDGSSPKSAPGT
jgi:hypothetical protein